MSEFNIFNKPFTYLSESLTGFINSNSMLSINNCRGLDVILYIR